MGAYPSILALEEGQALEKSRCFGRQAVPKAKTGVNKPCLSQLDFPGR
jgi:hypothetical protein